MVAAVYNLTSNQYYGGLNRRFSRRAALLHRVGFSFDKEANGWFHPRRERYGRKCWRIPAALLHHADNRAWYDILRDATR